MKHRSVILSVGKDVLFRNDSAVADDSRDTKRYQSVIEFQMPAGELIKLGNDLQAHNLFSSPAKDTLVNVGVVVNTVDHYAVSGRRVFIQLVVEQDEV